MDNATTFGGKTYTPVVPTATYVKTESVRLLYQHAWFMSLTVGLTATALTGYMFVDHVDTPLLLAWLVFINAIIAMRIGVIIAFTRLKPAENQYLKWGRLYLALAWLNGVAWGLPAFALNEQDLTAVYFYALVIGGFVAGAIPGLSFNITAFYGFALFASLPLITRLFLWESEPFRFLGLLALLFVTINAASARISHRRINQQIKLEYENRGLVAYLQAEKERAERANQVKTRFLAAASHDLRQPLHAIGLFVDALDARIKFPEVRRIMDNLKLSTEGLKGLLNSMLDISRLDAGALQSDVADFQLSLLLDQLALEFAPQAAAKGLSLRIRACDAWVRSDPIMLARVLRNLLSNAIRYTHTGGVLLGCRERNGKIRIEVHDTGKGIATNEINHVFEEFYQIGNPERDRDKGLGLGLAIVKRLADLLQHELAVHSEIGKGSTFSVMVQAATSTPHLHAPAQIYQGDLAETLILVIDDEEPIRNGMGEILQSWGCRTILADSADSAIEQLMGGRLVPDLIVADYRLRENKTGIQAIEGISAHVGRSVPAIIVTGDIAPERLREAKNCGYRLLHKPVSAASLRSLASYLIRRGPPLPELL